MKVIIVLLGLSLFGCNNSEHAALMDMHANDFEDVVSIPATQQPASDKRTVEKKIIRNGYLSYSVKNTKETYQQISKLLENYQAYIANESQSTQYDRISYDLTIRVPSENFDSLFNKIAGYAATVEHRSVSVEDVTDRYYDLSARIKNKKALEQRYIDLLNKAASVKDILEIEKNLNELRTQIEIEEGQFKNLAQQIQYSTISLSFYELLPYSFDAGSRPGFISRIKEALAEGWHGFLSFTIGLISLWPFIILVIAGIYTFKKIKFRLQRRKTKSKPVE